MIYWKVSLRFQSAFIPFLSISCVIVGLWGPVPSSPRLLDWEYRTASAGWIPHPLAHLGTLYLQLLKHPTVGTVSSRKPNTWSFQNPFPKSVPKIFHEIFQIHWMPQAASHREKFGVGPPTPWGAASPTISASSAMASQTSVWSQYFYRGHP